MKARIAACVGLHLSPTEEARVRKEVTVKVYVLGEKEVKNVCPAYKHDGLLWVPRQYGLRYLKSNAIPYQEDMTYGRAILPGLQPIKLYEEQKPWVGDILRLFNSGVHDVVAKAATGKGKTLMALEVFRRLGRKGLVIVDQEFLRDQWIARAVEFLGMSPKRIGLVQGPIMDYQGKDLVIAMVQSLTRKDYPDDFFEYFGTVLFDEVHTVGAETFSNSLMMFPAAYRLGVTATPRTDTLKHLLELSLGEVAVELSARHAKSSVRYVEYEGVLSWYANISPKSGRYINEIAADNERNLLLADIIYRLWRTGRDVLAVSDRSEHLEDIIELAALLGIPHEDMALVAGYETVWRYAKDPTPRRAPEGWDRDEGAEYTPVSLQLLAKRVARKELTQRKDTAKIIFACVSDDTECLTADGWKHVDNLVEGELIAAYDLKTKTVKYTPLRKIATYGYDGELCHVHTRSINALMTWNHRNVVRYRGKEGFTQASNLSSQSTIVLRAPMEYEENEGVGSDAFAELLGWVIAEGSIQDGRVRVSQKAGHKAARIDHLIQELHLMHTRRLIEKEGIITWHFTARESKSILQYTPDRLLNRYLADLPLTQLKSLFWGLIQGDGHTRNQGDGRMTFIQKSVTNIDWFTVIALRLDFMPSIGTAKLGADGIDTGCRNIDLTEITTTRIYQAGVKLQAKPEYYIGRVWCPVTDYQTWVARRKGRVFITGNTYGMFSKGVDVPRLSAGIDCTPRAKAQQVHGRILRGLAGKMKPIWVTIRDINSYKAEYQFAKRLDEYRESNAEVSLWNLELGVKAADTAALKKSVNQRVASLKKMRIITQLSGNHVLIP